MAWGCWQCLAVQSSLVYGVQSIKVECWEANLENFALLQEEENVGGEDSKPQQESPDPELSEGKKDLYLEGFIISLFQDFKYS